MIVGSAINQFHISTFFISKLKENYGKDEKRERCINWKWESIQNGRNFFMMSCVINCILFGGEKHYLYRNTASKLMLQTFLAKMYVCDIIFMLKTFPKDGPHAHCSHKPIIIRSSNLSHPNINNPRLKINKIKTWI